MKILLTTLLLAAMVAPAMGAQYLGDFNTDPNICITQVDSITALLDGSIPGAKLEYQSDKVLVFSAPEKMDFFQLNFENGCAAGAYSINSDEYKLLVNPT